MNNTAKFAVTGAAALVIGIGLGWAIRGVATYPMQAQVLTNYGDWRTACPPASAKDQSCRMIEQVMDTRTNQSVVQLAMGVDKGKNTLDVSVPLGVLLPAGVGLTIGDAKPVLFKFRTCTTAGCIGHLEMDDKTLASMNTAKDGKILVAGMDGKAVAIPISLKGYADAARAYRSAEQRRTSWFWRMFS
jgi:invasion protein IalB